MLVSNVSLWGAAIVACIVLVGSIVLGFFDKKMLRRVLAVYGVTVAQMAAIAVVVWVVYQTNAWWAYLLFYLLVLFLSVCWVLYPVHTIWKKMLVPVSTAMLAGSIVVGGSSLLCLPISVFMTVFSVLMACMTASMIQTIQNYQRSQHDPEVNKLSLRERILPNVRSMVQPMVMVIPTLFVGMMMGGVSALDGLIVVLVITAATFAANVLAGVIALLLIKC
jgi:hypothetical protein